MNISKDIFALIFGEIEQFCGKEDVIHAIIYHQLIESGLSPLQVAREQPISSNRIDIAVFDENVQGKFYGTHLTPKLALEVKGGAYGDRNALHDEITYDGYCKDMEKLEKEVNQGISSWFVCVDMPELGRAVNKQLLQKTHAQCAQRNISFAYFCQGEDEFFYAPTGTPPVTSRINTGAPIGLNPNIPSILTIDNPSFTNMCSQLLAIDGHEANTTAALYQLFRRSGLSASQVSLETYFSFAKKPNSRMHDRPDMVVFNQNFDGKFNLYRGGDRSKSNDSHKLSHINSIFEVKGSASISKKTDSARLKIYLEDIDKLQRWQSLAKAKGCNALSAYFICLDGRKNGLPRSAIDVMHAKSNGNPVVYISNNGVEVSA